MLLVLILGPLQWNWLLSGGDKVTTLILLGNEGSNNHAISKL